MRITVEEIRKRYPNPRNCGPSAPVLRSGYCVGGALCIYLQVIHGLMMVGNRCFPSKQTIAFHLRAANCALEPDIAEEYVAEIVRANDMGDFEAAWRLLGMALDHGQAPERPEPQAEEEELACV